MFVPYDLDSGIQYTVLAIGAVVAGSLAVRAIFRPERRQSLGRRIGWVAAVTSFTLLAYQGQILFRQASETAEYHGCARHLTSLGKAMDAYVHDTGHYPPADAWASAISKYEPKVQDGDILRCPASTSTFGYAYNRALSNLPQSKVRSPGSTIALFESDAKTENASGGPDDVARGRHIHRYSLFLTCDGLVLGLGSREESDLTWTP